MLPVINPALSRLRRLFVVSMIAYAVLVVVAVSLFRTGDPAAPVAVALAIAPALPVVGMVFAITRYLVEETDEYLRMLMVRRMIVATCIALSFATVLGFLENFRQIGAVPAFWVAVVWFASLGLADLAGLAERRAG